MGSLISRIRLAAWSAAPLLAVTLAGCDGNSTRNAASSSIGPAGGTVTVTTGELAGTSITVPAGALNRRFTIAIDLATVQPQPDVDAVGPAAAFTPSGTQFAQNATATLIFDPDDVPAGTPNGAFVVKRRDSQGRITDVAPGAVDQMAGTVTVSLSGLSAYWVAVRVADFVLTDYLPLQDGDYYEYDTGLVLSIKQTTGQPNLNGPVITATFVDSVGDFGWYLRRTFGGETLFEGRFSVTDSFQELVTMPLVILPREALIGDSAETEANLVGFQPFGSFVPSFAASEKMTTTFVSAGSLQTPLGQFRDVIEVEVVSEREGMAPGVTATSSLVRDRLWLARGIGPVHVSLQGLPLAQITGGIFNGIPFGGR